MWEHLEFQPAEPWTLKFGHVDFWPLMGQESQGLVKIGNFAPYRGLQSMGQNCMGQNNENTPLIEKKKKQI